MSSIPTMAGRLVRAGLPPRYVARAMRELCDHRSDAGDIGEFGDLHTISDCLISEYRRTRFLGRRPYIGFLLLPPLLLILCWCVYFAITGISFMILTPELDTYDWVHSSLAETHPVTIKAMWLTYFVGKVLPFAVAGWVFASWALNSGRSKCWLLVSISIIAMCSFLFVGSELSLPNAVNSGEPKFCLSIGTPDGFNRKFNEQLAQAIVPVCVATVLVSRVRGKTRIKDTERVIV